MSDSKTYPRDVFLYLLSIITLVTVAVSLGILVYQYINLQYPDVLSEGYYWSKTSTLNSVRNSMAVLIVVFPVFLWVSWFLGKDINKHPEKKDLKIRRWLLYLTLFIASLVIIGDLVALLISFLNGELTTRFILKVVTILGIAGSIVVHYFSELRDNSFSWIKIFDKIIVLLMVVAVLSGFWIAGSPSQQRSVRLDERRVSDLSMLQYQIIYHWQYKRVLPSSLNDLNNDISGFVVPVDPEDGSAYGYRPLNTLSFELCAEFLTSNLNDKYNSGEEGPTAAPVVGGIEANWSHGQGEVCFERTIDPDYYPPIDEVKPLPVR